MADISFTIDEEGKVVYPQLPELQIESPTVDTKSLEFFEQNPDVDMKDVIKLCKKDAQSKVNNDSDIKSTAESNLKKTIEALTSPLLKSKGYTLSWDAPAEEAEDAQQE